MFEFRFAQIGLGLCSPLTRKIRISNEPFIVTSYKDICAADDQYFRNNSILNEISPVDKQNYLSPFSGNTTFLLTFKFLILVTHH